jgi:hypothetical protein
LQERKAEIALLCKERENEISTQIDYISNNLGSIALRTFIGGKSGKETSTKSDIISLLVSNSVETIMEIKRDPHNIQNKLVDFIKKATSGIINQIITR